MKQTARAIKSSASFEERMRTFASGAWQRVQALFLQRLGILQLICLLITALISVLVVRALLFTEVEEPLELTAGQEVRLAVPLVNELELWLEDRQTAYEKPPVIPVEPFTGL